jgi:hypothetical protein
LSRRLALDGTIKHNPKGFECLYQVTGGLVPIRGTASIKNHLLGRREKAEIRSPAGKRKSMTLQIWSKLLTN